MRTALLPGPFDPFHNGHLDVVTSAARLFDRVIVVAVHFPPTAVQLFDLGERRTMIRDSTAHLPNVRVVSFAVDAVEVARRVHADVIVKGLRASTDFERELQLAQMNEAVFGLETVFLPTSAATAFIASSLIRDVARFGGADRVSGFVPAPVLMQLRQRFGGAVPQ